MRINTNREKLLLDNTVLMVIDIQEKLYPFIENKDEVLKNNSILIKGAKALGLKTVITEQYPKGLGKTINELQEDIADLDRWEKTSFSVGRDNAKEIQSLVDSGKNTFILSGIESHICVYQTAKDLLNKDLTVVLAYDACGSRKKENHEKIIDTLRDLGALILPTESVLFELMVNSKHPGFKQISSLVK